MVEVVVMLSFEAMRNCAQLWRAMQDFKSEPCDDCGRRGGNWGLRFSVNWALLDDDTLELFGLCNISHVPSFARYDDGVPCGS